MEEPKEGCVFGMLVVGESFGNTMGNGKMALKEYVSKAVIVEDELLKEVDTSRVRPRRSTLTGMGQGVKPVIKGEGVGVRVRLGGKVGDHKAKTSRQMAQGGPGDVLISGDI